MILIKIVHLQRFWKYFNLLIQVQKEEKKRELSKNEGELNILKEKYNQYIRQNEILTEDLKKVEAKLQKFNKNINDEEMRMKNLDSENKWIAQEKSFFGTKDSEYDFENFNEKAESEKLSKFKEENAVLKRKVNMKVDMMSDQYEKEYPDLI